MAEFQFQISPQQLLQRLGEELPGEMAQYEMAPDLRKMRFPDEILQQAKQSAILIAVFPAAGVKVEGHEKPLPLEMLHIAYMKRAEYPGVHSGQISFPGGAYETEDGNYETTALREAEEEVGIPVDQVDLFGPLTSLYVPPSGFMIHPYIGWLEAHPNFILDVAEVAHVFTVSLAHLLDPAVKSTMEMKIASGVKVDAPVYNFQTDRGVERVWGATAMITSEFETIVREIAAK